jgi:hypothetical protein
MLLSETWDLPMGKPFSRKTEDEIITDLRPSWIQGLSILGGDPMEPENQRSSCVYSPGQGRTAGQRYLALNGYRWRKSELRSFCPMRT